MGCFFIGFLFPLIMMSLSSTLFGARLFMFFIYLFIFLFIYFIVFCCYSPPWWFSVFLCFFFIKLSLSTETRTPFGLNLNYVIVFFSNGWKTGVYIIQCHTPMVQKFGIDEWFALENFINFWKILLEFLKYEKFVGIREYWKT